MKNILIIEREYGCGAGPVAEQAAQHLGWRLWDRDLTVEIAQRAKVTPEECVQREEHVDSWLYRLGKIFWRGSHEVAMPLTKAQMLDADRMAELVEQVVMQAAKSAPCVIVGRDAPYILRNRTDTFSVFLYAPRAFKVERMAAILHDRAQAEHLVDSVDRGRAAFVRHYFCKTWPNRFLYHLMVNTVIGIEQTVDVLLQTMAAAAPNERTALDNV